MKTNLKMIVHTDSGVAALFLRIALGVMILPHGLQKTMGLFGGYGFSGTMAFFTHQMGIPWAFALAAILVEFLGGIALLVGAATRIAAAAVGTTMLVAALTSHIQNGFFMNWFGNQSGEGFEFHILAVGISSALIALGGGGLSIDRKLGLYFDQ